MKWLLLALITSCSCAVPKFVLKVSEDVDLSQNQDVLYCTWVADRVPNTLICRGTKAIEVHEACQFEGMDERLLDLCVDSLERCTHQLQACYRPRAK